MQTTTVFLVLIALCCVSFLVGRKRSQVVALRLGGLATLHSLPRHYGYMVAAWAMLPALLLLVLWLGFESGVLYELIVAQLPQSVRDMPASELGLYYNQIQSFALGAIDSAQLDTVQVEAASHYRELVSVSGQVKAALVILVAAVGALLAIRRVTPALRARNHVEKIFIRILFCSSFLAVLTTLGIVLSVLFEAIRFFQAIPIWPTSCLGSSGAPRWRFRADQVAASGSFGFLPLLLGTLLISVLWHSS